MTDLTPEERTVLRRRIDFRRQMGHERVSVTLPELTALLDAADEADRLTAVIPCDERYTEPYDFAYCEAHDRTFALGSHCDHAGLSEVDYLGERERGQRVRAIRAEDERDRLQDVERRLAVLLCNLTGGKLSKTDYPVELMEQEIEEYLAGHHESDLRDERDRLAAQVEQVRALHVPFRIYDECECEDTTTPGHVDVEEVGITCNLLHIACRECCTSGVDIRYQTEDCANGHDHRDRQCPTIAALDGDEQ